VGTPSDQKTAQTVPKTNQITLRTQSKTGSWKPHPRLKLVPFRDSDIEPLGFAPDADWILNSRYTHDLALIRNTFVYGISNQMGRWAVDTQFVELYNDVSGGEVDGSDYFGVYTFMERIEVGEDRLDIRKLKPWENGSEEVTGGYIFKNDRQSPTQPTFKVDGFVIPMVFVDPDWGQSTLEQRSYLTNYSNEVTAALRASDGIHPTSGLHFSDYLDVDSFIDNFWLQILTMAPDWGRRSQYFHKDRGGKIMAGPNWDYDRTMGSRESRDDNPRRWVSNTNDTSSTWFDKEHEWFGLLFGFTEVDDQIMMQDPQLRTNRPDTFQKVIDRWYSLREDELSQLNMEAVIDKMADEVRESQVRNFARWSSLSPGIIQGLSFASSGTGWEREISHLKGWLKARTEWIDDQFFAPPSFNQVSGAVPENFNLVMTSPKGDIYYTTDRTDPRAEGGDPRVNAVQGSSVTLNDTTTVIARAYDGQQWGAPTKATFVIGGSVASFENLVISEIMYAPGDSNDKEIAAGFTDRDEFEYIELLNTSGSEVDLAEVFFATGLSFTFAGASMTIIPPGERILIVRNRIAFLERYGAAQANRIAGEFSNDTGLSSKGERIVLSGISGVIADFTYNHKYPWPESSDGGGPSLVLVDPGGGADASLGVNWRPSVEVQGNPGSGNSIAFVGDPLADNDHDGLTALLEYALGLNDTVVQTEGEVLTGGIDIEGRFNITFTRNLAADDARVILQVSSDLQSWAEAGEFMELSQENHNGDGTIKYQFRVSNGVAVNHPLFVRLLIVAR